ncbi:tRNA (adenine(58)-N(1))-methyltransferase non-catalytic subunit trm6 [Yamadazyma tenuis]|uniref:tRNA (adenine(58)-N(1))-methyltransferase non-catalytic subunit TRM6 n=1 Tax=Candida tenuis (strain ATCC 10573 / BCRC 21748 / CBS 615 / JCM 9827 / NBRC 10315 / NRRL Y-1498 / VKM Y-70) TaxID=590646 RepID=G3BF45_CANTC|nr:adenine-N(1)--methyltransferase [Yamadazyma tenuis ATCC 10573]EGV60631.1 adenine-N(1)--methyltransferase [Yamadazyma tenuis ATCC 10573]WEJ94120.1 tRNA (adenine(58)-N(1))-methyltransferase non-catalytic subunit trm6 [Yamadazyma tenuis]
MKDRSTITENHYVLVRLPSAGMKVVELRKGGNIALGKFGAFNVDDVLGYTYGQSFEIIDNDKLRPIKSLSEEVEMKEESSEDVEAEGDEEIIKDRLIKMLSNSSENNQNIINIGSKIQKLTNEEIDELKKSGATSNIGQLIIQKMIEGHEGFDKKTIFSQQKYLKRKQEKFLRRFTIDYLGSSQMLQYYLEKDSSKLLDMSEETLGSLMTYSNVKPGGKYLLIDETGGVILYSMLERMNCEGTVVLIHENEHANYSALKHSNLSDDLIRSKVKMINWLQILEPENEKIDFQSFSEAELNEMKAPKRSQYYRRQKRANDINEVIEMVQQGNFDAFISITTLDPTTYLPFVIPKVGGSRPITVYSQFKETLLQTQHFLSSDKRILAPSIFETRVRPYQTIPGRIHPLMTMRGYGGYIMVGTRVFPKESVQAVGRGMGRRKTPKKDESSMEPEDSQRGETPYVPEDSQKEDTSFVPEDSMELEK